MKKLKKPFQQCLILQVFNRQTTLVIKMSTNTFNLCSAYYTAFTKKPFKNCQPSQKIKIILCKSQATDQMIKRSHQYMVFGRMGSMTLSWGCRAAIWGGGLQSNNSQLRNFGDRVFFLLANFLMPAKVETQKKIRYQPSCPLCLLKKQPWFHGNFFWSGRYNLAGMNKINQQGKTQEFSFPKPSFVQPISVSKMIFHLKSNNYNKYRFIISWH